jgi:catechol 2,3-dioxygenase-like lactoylglutathione lyase family enzyme
MIDYQRLFHTGFIVGDMREAMDHYGATMGVTWAAPRVIEAMRLWRPTGAFEDLRLEYVYSAEGPQHIELLRGSAGSYYDPATQHGFHVGIWVDDVGAETEGLLAKGWTIRAAGAGPEDGYGHFSYLLPPGGRMVVELVSQALLPGFEEWWAGAA